jgi:hypothetical protein
MCHTSAAEQEDLKVRTRRSEGRDILEVNRRRHLKENASVFKPQKAYVFKEVRKEY